MGNAFDSHNSSYQMIQSNEKETIYTTFLYSLRVNLRALMQ